ncbi:chemotaxis protein CheB [Stenotrophomonas sp. HITSZ_GD]|uniref:chemotaxis protein CheB n=1 Tax=Stenotrophomonas sp. HITSZ_GD TaxID=3037248 RepID=UPI00240E3C46|nr:chemotaxis protein CheB [Stenotrophomonas sp. HITSZ_GD]MDG2525877.1 chemotaxis protein CheB [Stenotrophomonas sp. HITSZ_GD]
MGTPVALLGRSGPARERMREALSLIGARVVLEDEPGAIDARTLADAEPAAVLVALEPAIEDALEALEPVLNRPDVTVIFDEAELAARREGWDAQRWARHLAAKLHGHGDVLPPGAEQEPSWTPEPGLPVTPAELHSAQPVAPHLQAAAQALDEVPGDALFTASTLSLAPEEDVVVPVIERAHALLEPIDAPFADAPVDTPAPAPASALGDSSTWGLVEDVAIVERPRSEAQFDHLPDGGLSLVDLESAAATKAQGAVLVMAGIGGPDAIRRLLGALPAEFPRAVLIRMPLDGGQYGNLVRQMGRVSPLPVELAEAGLALAPGKAYILPDGVGLVIGEAGLSFAEGEGSAVLVPALPADDSAVLLLSGASEALVPDVLALAEQGAWVAGQSAEGCYDPAAAARLVQQGRPSGDPVQLAQSLAERWPG